MTLRSHWYILTYDIRCRRRLQRTHKFLRTEAYAIQESVFAWFGNQQQVDELRKKLLSHINPAKDDFRGYRLPANKPLYFWGDNPFLGGIMDNRYPPHIYDPNGSGHGLKNMISDESKQRNLTGKQAPYDQKSCTKISQLSRKKR